MNASPGALAGGARLRRRYHCPSCGCPFNRSRRPRVHSAALRLTRYIVCGDAPSAHAVFDLRTATNTTDCLLALFPKPLRARQRTAFSCRTSRRNPGS